MSEWHVLGCEDSPHPLRIRRRAIRGFDGFDLDGSCGEGIYPLPDGLLTGLDVDERPIAWLTKSLVGGVMHFFQATAFVRERALHIELEDRGPAQDEDGVGEWYLRDIGGQGGRVLECVVCGASDYAGALIHKSGCDDLRAQVAQLRQAPVS